MKQKLLFTLMFLMTWGTGSAWADDPAEAQYTAATANITAGTYRIYALSGGTKYYLKVNSTSVSSDQCHTYVVTSTDPSDAAEFTIAKATDSSTPLKSSSNASWDIYNSTGLRFTNQNNISNDPSNDGYLHGRNNNGTDAYRHQILYYDGAAYAVRATNSTSSSWGGSLYWGLVEYNSTPNTAGYVTDAAFIWHFEPVIETGYYRLYGAGNQALCYATAESGSKYRSDKNTGYTGSDNSDVWQLVAGSSNGYSLQNVKTTTYANVTSSASTTGVGFSLSTQQDLTFIPDGTNWYITDGSTNDYRYINFNSGSGKGVTVWNKDANDVITLLPMSAYTLTVVGQTGATVTVSANDHNSVATTGNIVYIDDRATSSASLTVTATVGDDAATATITGFNTTLKTIEVTVGNYSRTFATADQKYTVCLPFAAITSSYNGKFYELTSYSDNTLYFTEFSGTTTIYKPYLFVPDEANVTITGAITAYNEGTYSSNLTTTVDGVSFVGTVAPQALVSTVGTTYYGYRASDGYFVQVGTGTGANIGAYRAYIQIPGASPVKAFNVVLDEATGIEDAVQSSKLKVQSTFDLQGRRLQNPTHGLYIVNGKKVLVK